MVWTWLWKQIVLEIGHLCRLQISSAKCCLRIRFEEMEIPPECNPWQQASWGQHGAHLGPTGPRWAPCWAVGPKNFAILNVIIHYIAWTATGVANYKVKNEGMVMLKLSLTIIYFVSIFANKMPFQTTLWDHTRWHDTVRLVFHHLPADLLFTVAHMSYFLFYMDKSIDYCWCLYGTAVVWLMNPLLATSVICIRTSSISWS